MSDHSLSMPEESSLAYRDDVDAPTPLKPTPLPKLQIFIVSLVQFSEPIAALVIYPFINQFVRETGITQGDDRKTGYYAGIIESVFFFAECSTVVQWSYLSDRIGRRPVLLIGPVGLTFSMILFGTSTTFVSLVISRFCQGAFNGCIGVVYSMIAEMTDPSNVGDAYAFLPLMWSVGSTIAPIIGGLLSNPATRWPNTLGSLQYLREHPYFLPCAVSGFITTVTFSIAVLALKETLPSLVAKRKTESIKTDIAIADDTIETSLINHGEGLDYGSTIVRVQSSSESTSTTVEDKPPLLNRGLVMIYLNFVTLAFLDMGHFVLLPLFYSTSIPLGGLGLDPYQIGISLGTSGFVNAIMQATFLGPLIRKFGARKVYIISFPGLLGCFALYPILTHFTQCFGKVFISASYGSIQVVLAQHLTGSENMGTAIGIAQMSTAGTRSIAPAVVSSLFSISLQRHLAGGNLVFYLLMGLTLLAIRVSYLLPPRIIWKSWEQAA